MVYIEFESNRFSAPNYDAALAFLERDHWVEEVIPDYPRNTYFKKPNPDSLDRENPFIFARIIVDDNHPLPLSALPSVVALHHHHP